MFFNNNLFVVLQLPGTDLIIEKNTPIYVSINGTNRDPRYFNNPDEFNPLRSKSAMQEISSSSLAFGLGPRSCIGNCFLYNC